MTLGNAAPDQFVSDRPYAKPDAAGRRLLELANSVNPTNQGWIHVEKVNNPLLFKEGALPAEYGAGTQWLISEGLIDMHESGCYFVMSQAAKDMFA